LTRLGEPFEVLLGPASAFVVLRLNGRRFANLGSGLTDLGCCQLVILDPKKLEIPPIVDRTSGKDEAAGDADAGVGLSRIA
jgi:hypothetical protein